MSEQTGHEPAGTPFAAPGGPRTAPTAARAVDEPRPAAPSPYAPPTTGDGSPFAPPAAPQQLAASGPPFVQPPAYGQPAYGQPPAYGQQPAYGQPPAYGQQPYGQPSAYGSPPTYDAPPPYGGPPPYSTPYGYGGGFVTPPTEGLAIASLVTSVAGLVVLAGIPGPVGLGLGIGALRRIRQRGTRGRGMAIAGVVVGAVSTLVCIGWVSLAVWGWTDQGVADVVSMGEGLPDYTLRTDLVVGDCLREYPGSWDLGTADPVDCAEEHALQIVSVLPMPGPVDSMAEPSEAGYDSGFALCSAQIERAAPGLLDEYTVWTDVSFPHPDDWSSGATTAYCAVATDYPELRGSVLDGSVTGPE